LLGSGGPLRLLDQLGLAKEVSGGPGLELGRGPIELRRGAGGEGSKGSARLLGSGRLGSPRGLGPGGLGLRNGHWPLRLHLDLLDRLETKLHLRSHGSTWGGCDGSGLGGSGGSGARRRGNRARLGLLEGLELDLDSGLDGSGSGRSGRSSLSGLVEN